MASSKSVVFLFTFLSFLVIILSLLKCVILITLFNVFNKHREKYAKPDFVKFISLEINYFVGTGCFLFLRNINTLFFQVAKVSFPSPFFQFPLFFIHFSTSFVSLTVTARFLGLGRDKALHIFELSMISHNLHISFLIIYIYIYIYVYWYITYVEMLRNL